METAETVSTSAKTAAFTPVVLRLSDQIRLIFSPTLVENAHNPRAGIRGEFSYQRKGKADAWESATELSLGTIKKGEAYKLELHSAELLTLVETLGPLYRLVWKEGIPQGVTNFVKVEAGLGRFLKLNEQEFKAFLDAHADDAAKTLGRLLQWLALSPKLPDVVDALAALAPTDVPPLSALLGLATMKSAYNYWKDNSTNGDEEFWQKALAARTFVLSQLFSYPVIMLGEKAYIGGKSFLNTGGALVDFLFQSASTRSLLLLEIKTPKTKLLSSEYRKGVFPPSSELSGAVAQALHYRQSTMANFHSLAQESALQLTLGEPRAVVIAGNSEELATSERRESFELYRHQLGGVTVITFDEIFDRLGTSIKLVESAMNEP